MAVRTSKVRNPVTRNSGAAAARRPDDVLIRRAQRGDRAALDEVARAVLPLLRRWARTHVAAADDADDVAQIALIAATRHLAGFDHRSGLDTWLYRIVRRCAADHFRTVRRRDRLAERDAARPADAWTTGDSAEDLDLRRAAGTVRREFRRLPARQREVFDLVDLQGFAAEEVAAMLGLAAPTVRVHLLRARRALRSIMLETEPAFVEDRGGLQDRT